MKKILTIVFSICLIINIYGQDVKTGEVQSSILLETTNIGFDIGETSLSFTTNNFPQSKLKSNGAIWGLFAKGKSDEGLTSIFSSSQIVPSSEISAICGYSFSNLNKIIVIYDANTKVLEDSIEMLTIRLKDSLETKVNELIEKITDIKARKYISNAVNSQSKFLYYENIEKSLKKISENTFIDKSFSSSAKPIYEFIQKNKTWIDYKRINKKISNNINSIKPEDYWKFSFYGHFGLKSTKFNIYKGWDSLNIDNSFEKEIFAGSNGGFGLNLNIKSKWMFGFRFTYEETNNLSMLSSKDYKVTTNYTSASTTGSSQISMTAYPNKYTLAYLNRYDFDIIRFFALDESNIVLTDFYFRIKESTDQIKIISQRDLGISASFFKERGKFIGGIYVEIPDIEQNVERQKPVDEQKLEDWYKRLSFGVYAKFSISSIKQQF